MFKKILIASGHYKEKKFSYLFDKTSLEVYLIVKENLIE